MAPAHETAGEGVEVLPWVKAELNYLAPTGERPRTYTYDPPAGVPRSTAVNAPHHVPISDVRPILSKVALDDQGFGLVRHRSAVHDFYSEEEVKAVYYPEAEQILKDATGADRVLIFDSTVRRRVPGAEDRLPGAPRQPVPRVHVDHTATIRAAAGARPPARRGGVAAAGARADHQPVAPDPRAAARHAARGLRCPERAA